ncbi:MAG: BMP family ABC transporter substrate-binding protein [Agathobacter sp.]|nr:BMP family ABC transporter substrate-binding protein [Agathobacter sp.]
MKKKILAAVMSAAMVFGLAACGASSDSGNAGQSAGSTENAAAEATTDKSDFKIGLVTDTGGVNDQSFNQSAWEGLQAVADEYGVTVNYLESSGDADYVPNITSFMDEDYDLIICVGYMLADATRQCAESDPDQKFAIIDDSSCSDLDNVTCLMFKQEQASYLVGYVAGLMTETNNIGFVLGNASETMHLFGYGYIAGATDANPDIKVQQYNAASFADAAGGKTAATTMVTNGADIIFHAAGGTGVGVIDGCKEAGIYAIGVDSDQSYLAPDTIITSAMKRVDVAVETVCKEAIDGTVKGGVETYELSNGGVDIAPTTTLLPDDVISQVEDVKQKIISGEITVPSSQAEFEATYGDVYELD